MHQTARTREEVVSLIAELERRSKTAKDIVMPANRLEVVTNPAGTNGDRIVAILPAIGDAVTPLGLTPTAHSQLAAKLGIPKPYYDRMLHDHPSLLVENVNSWADLQQGRWMLRILDDTLRAFLSDRYRQLDNYDLAFTTLAIANERGVEIDSVTLTNDRFEMRLIHPEWREEIDLRKASGSARTGGVGGTSVLIPGCYVRNSETGRGGLSVHPFIRDLVCLNGMVGEANFGRIHLGEQLTEGSYLSDETRKQKDAVIWSEVRDLVNATFDRDRFRTLIDEMTGTAKQELLDPVEAVNAVVTNYGMTDEDRQAILNQLISPSHDRDPGRTVFGLISAVTERAKAYDDPERRTDFEEAGAELIRKGRELVEVRVR